MAVAHGFPNGSRPVGSAHRVPMLRKSLSVSAFAGSAIRVRFRIRHESGSLYNDSGSHIGFRIDDISVTNSSLAAAPQLTTVPASSSSFTLSASTAGAALTAGTSYLMRVRPIFDGASFGFGPALTVEVGAASGFDAWVTNDHPTLVGGFSGDHDGDGIFNGIEYILGTNPTGAFNSSPVPEFSGTTASLSFLPAPSTDDVRCIGQYSQDLEIWIDIADSDPGPGYAFSVSTQNMDRVFMRLKAIRQ